MTTIPPLVHMVADDEVKKEAKDIFAQIKKTAGEIPKWMRVMANCEDTLYGFFTLFKSLMDDAPTDKLLKWKIAFVVSEANKCEFCVSVSKVQLKKFGLDEKAMKGLEKACDIKECVALEYAKEVALRSYKMNPDIMKRMKEHFTDAQIVEITSVVGLFSFINRFNDALGILPDV